MNTVTLDSMASDNFEVAGTPVLSEAEGGSVLGGIIVGAGAGFVGAMKGAEEGSSCVVRPVCSHRRRLTC